jgi:hypothetical protein
MHSNAPAGGGGWQIINPGGSGGGGGWSDPAWIQLGTSNIYYRKDLKDIVHMRGQTSINSGTIGTLPAGYRPQNFVEIVVPDQVVILDQFSSPFNCGVVVKTGRVESSGIVQIVPYTSGSSESVSFDGVTFEAQ